MNYQMYDTIMLVFITVFSFIEMSLAVYDHKKDIKKVARKVTKKLKRTKRKSKPKLKLITEERAASNY
jgi:hypothetical protein